jgi:hypothetical protein
MPQCFRGVSGIQGPLVMTLHYTTGEAFDQSTARGEIESRISWLKRLHAAKYAALPLVAIGAGAGLFIPVAFPAIAGTTAALVGAAEIFSRNQRKILQEEIKAYKDRFNASEKEITALSSSANTVTVSGPST